MGKWVIEDLTIFLDLVFVVERVMEMGKVAIKVTRITRHVKRKKMLIERWKTPDQKVPKFSPRIALSYYFYVYVFVVGRARVFS